MGMAGCSEDAPHWLQIGVDVIPEYRGRGVGAFIVNSLKNEVLRRGDIPFYGTAAANIHSQNIAIKCGFKPVFTEIGVFSTHTTYENQAPETSDEKTWVDDMKQELEDYIEEQGIYIRQ